MTDRDKIIEMIDNEEDNEILNQATAIELSFDRDGNIRGYYIVW